MSTEKSRRPSAARRPAPRPYRQSRRAQSKAQTRQRIVEAIVALHQELGPAHTTISAIAERAGVERLTVYRHFPDELAQLVACSAHWSQSNPLPDPAPWQRIRHPRQRTSAALDGLYHFYSRGHPMLRMILRDAPENENLQKVMQPFLLCLESLARTISDPWSTAPDPPLLRAAVRHALQFTTWQSLTAQKLSRRHAVDLMTRLIAAAAQPNP